MPNCLIDRAKPKFYGIGRLQTVDQRIRLGFLAILTVGGGIGCRDVVGSAALPPGTQSPTTYNTPEGALAMYRATKAKTGVVLGGSYGVIITSGTLTDELLAATVGTSPQSIGATGDPVDERVLLEGETNSQNTDTYSMLHELRGYAAQAIGLLQHYAPNTSPALRGEMYALLGYAELQLAELYCSGVPLSTLDFGQDFTYKPSSTTQEVLAHAVALEDTALALSGDSARALNLARVLKGRALLSLGQYTEAAQTVTAVPDTFRYDVPVVFNSTGAIAFQGWTVADTEGGNGLPFVSAADPRVPVTAVGSNPFGRRLFAPAQYPLRATPDTVVLASGVEARLIEAEAALHGVSTGRGTWLQILNALRTTGGVAGLPPLADPGVGLSGQAATDARVDLLFAERGYWLFLTGHRQGDLRRLVRVASEGGYERRQNRVYPTGPYYGGQGTYGGDVNLPIPMNAEGANPLFHGCLSQGA